MCGVENYIQRGNFILVDVTENLMNQNVLDKLFWLFNLYCFDNVCRTLYFINKFAINRWYYQNQTF